MLSWYDYFMNKVIIQRLLFVASLLLTLPAVSALTVSPPQAELVGNPGETIKNEFTLTSCLELTKNLSKGQENNEVLLLQQFLFDKGYLTQKPNGYFGNGTVTAVKKFQIANGLSSVGSVGIATRKKVKETSCLKSGTTSTPKVIQEETQSTTTFSTKTSSSVSDRQWIEEPSKYNYITEDISYPYLQIISKKLAYGTIKDKKLIIILDGKEIGGHDNAFNPVDIGGKLAYTAGTDKKTFIVYNGKEIGKEYDSAGRPTNIGGKLAYVASKKGKYFIVYDGKELEKEYDGIYSRVLLDVDGELAYQTNKNGKDFIVYRGKEIGKEYYGINQALVLNKKLSYVATEYFPGKISKFFIVYDGKEIGKVYDGASTPSFVDGKLTYVAFDSKNNKYFIVYDGKEIGKEYDSAVGLINFNAGLAYIAKKDNKMFIVYEGKQASEQYDFISSLQVIGGKLMYSGWNNNYGVRKYFLVYDGKVVGEKYDNIFSPLYVDGKLVYIGIKIVPKGDTEERNYFIVREK